MAEELLPDLLVCPFESIRLTKSKTDFIFYCGVTPSTPADS